MIRAIALIAALIALVLFPALGIIVAQEQLVGSKWVWESPHPSDSNKFWRTTFVIHSVEGDAVGGEQIVEQMVGSRPLRTSRFPLSAKVETGRLNVTEVGYSYDLSIGADELRGSFIKKDFRTEAVFTRRP